MWTLYTNIVRLKFSRIGLLYTYMGRTQTNYVIMKISIYQSSRECYFWTKEELSFIEETHPMFFKSNGANPNVFDFKGYEVTLYRGQWHRILNDGFDSVGDVNIIVIDHGAIATSEIESIIAGIKKNPENKFIIVGKNVEDYWLLSDTRTSDDLFKRIGELNNLTVIWDVDGVNYNNMFFEPKVNFHNYYNNSTFPGYMFINGSDIFHKLPKEHRIGIHLNKITDKVRKWLFDTYTNNYNPNLFFTSRKHRNIDSFIFDNELGSTNGGGVTKEWYNAQFIELTTKTSMEVIYETFTTTSEHRWLLKWNEKTIKQLFLSKPFIHADPAAHSLFKVNGLKAYRSLFTDELWDMYEEYDNKELLLMNRSEQSVYWSEALERNIEWLLGMDSSDWEIRIEEANKVAIQNRKIIEGYLFNESLFKYV